MNRNSLHRVANTRAKATNDTLILHYTIQCTKFSKETLDFIQEIQASTEYKQFEKRGLWKMGTTYSFTPYGSLADSTPLQALEQNVRAARGNLKGNTTPANIPALETAVNDAIKLARAATPTFIGMIKSGTSVANNNALSLKVIVRGVVSVPIWWFTKTDFTTRNHRYMGPFFRHNKSQAKKATDTMTNAMTDNDWLKTINRPSGSRAPMDGIECFFKM